MKDEEKSDLSLIRCSQKGNGKSFTIRELLYFDNLDVFGIKKYSPPAAFQQGAFVEFILKKRRHPKTLSCQNMNTCLNCYCVRLFN
jgi:hypothetical protein